MGKGRTEAQIISALKQVEAGCTLEDERGKTIGNLCITQRKGLGILLHQLLDAEPPNLVVFR